jgi:hypothetical protein
MQSKAALRGRFRGEALDRYYAGRFFGRELERSKECVLEIVDADRSVYSTRAPKAANVTSLRFFGDTKLFRDLAALQDRAYPTVIMEQVLQLIYDLDATLAQLHRILAPGGVLLGTVPGTCYTPARGSEHAAYWGFTDRCARTLLESHFPPDSVTIETFGNVLVAMAHAYGVGAGELTKRELEHRDSHYPFLLAVRAQKAHGVAWTRSTGAPP